MSLPLFEVDAAGFRELHARRPAWRLAMEVVSNALDEPGARLVEVELRRERRGVVLVVKDDGNGFASLRDAWTLYGHTPKRSDSTVRGRFNLGEKEVVAVAARGSIETTSGTVTFSRAGRSVHPRRRLERGTVVTLHLPWLRAEADEVEKMLARIIPNKEVRVNGKEVQPRRPLRERAVSLRTPVLDGDAMVERTRETSLHIHAPPGPGGLLFEMGVPVCESGTPFDIDVRQKVPLGPDRESVSPQYLRDVWAETLNAVHLDLNPDQLMEPWVQTALADRRTTEEAVESIKERIYRKTLLWSSDTLANERARGDGWTVLHPRHMAPEVRERLAIPHTTDLFGLTPKTPDPVEPDATMRAFADTVTRLAQGLGLGSVAVRFYSLRGAYECASWSGGTVSFNVANLPGDFFDAMGPAQVSLVLHEFAHSAPRGPDGEPHGSAFKAELQRLAGRAVELALMEPERFALVPPPARPPGS